MSTTWPGLFGEGASSPPERRFRAAAPFGAAPRTQVPAFVHYHGCPPTTGACQQNARIRMEDALHRLSPRRDPTTYGVLAMGVSRP